MNNEDKVTASEEIKLTLVDSKKPMTNTEFITDLMEYSYHGALTQIFIIEAIKRYAEIIVAQAKPTDPGTSFISAIAWHEIAEEIKTRMEAAYWTTK